MYRAATEEGQFLIEKKFFIYLVALLGFWVAQQKIASLVFFQLSFFLNL